MTERGRLMRVVQGFAGRAALSLAQQTSLSLLGTLAATALVAGLKAEWPMDRASPSAVWSAPQPPPLTRGGKFAARIGDGDDAEPFVTLTLLPPTLPLFTAPTVPVLVSDGQLGSPAPAADGGSTPIGPKPQFRVALNRHRTAGVAPMPPRREIDASMATAPSRPEAGVADSAEPSLWIRSRSMYRQVAAWTGSMADSLLP